MLKIIWFFKKKTLYHASTINVAFRETGSSEPSEYASTVAMNSEIPLCWPILTTSDANLTT